MPREKIVAGLDIGTCNIRIIAAKFREGNPLPQIAAVAQVPSAGLRKGVVVDIAEAAKSVSRAKELAQKSLGLPLDSVFVNINGSHLNCRQSKGVVAVSRADGEISEEDKNRAINASSAISLLPNSEILHILPRRFAVDNQTDIKDPVGMRGVRLEVDSLLIEGLTPSMKSLAKCLQEADLEAAGFMVSALASSRSVLNKRQKELGVLVLDMGGATTNFTVFEEGDILHCRVLPIGSLHITNDIAIGLRTSVEVAEKVKLEFGSLRPSQNKKEMIDLGKMGDAEGEEVARHAISEIIEARVNEIFDLVNKELKKIDRAGLLPAGVVLCGGGAKLPGLVEFAKEKLRLPVALGFPQEIEGLVEDVNDPIFAAACGLVSLGEEDEFCAQGSGSSFEYFKAMKPWAGKFKKWFKSFLP